VKFEWLPIKCNHYLMFGHEGTSCRKKERVRKEWRPIPKEENAALATTPLPLASQPRNPEVEFTPVTRRAAVTHTPIASPNRNPQSKNQYHLLSMDPVLIQEQGTVTLVGDSNGSRCLLEHQGPKLAK